MESSSGDFVCRYVPPSVTLKVGVRFVSCCFALLCFLSLLFLIPFFSLFLEFRDHLLCGGSHDSSSESDR